METILNNIKGKIYMITHPLLRTEQFMCNNKAEKYIRDHNAFSEYNVIVDKLKNTGKLLASRVIENEKDIVKIEKSRGQILLCSAYILKWHSDLFEILNKYYLNNGDIISCISTNKIIIHLGYTCINKGGTLKKEKGEEQKDIIIINPLSDLPIGLENLQKTGKKIGIYEFRADFYVALEALNYYRAFFNKFALNPNFELTQRNIYIVPPSIEDTFGKSMPHWFKWINELKEGDLIRVHCRKKKLENFDDLFEIIPIKKIVGSNIETKVYLNNDVVLNVEPGFIVYEGINKSFGLEGKYNNQNVYVSEYDYKPEMKPWIAVDAYHGGNPKRELATIRRFYKGLSAYPIYGYNVAKEILNFTNDNVDNIINKIDMKTFETRYVLNELNEDFAEIMSIEGGHNKKIHSIHLGDEDFMTTIESDSKSGLLYRFSESYNETEEIYKTRIKKWWTYHVLNDLPRWCK